MIDLDAISKRDLDRMERQVMSTDEAVRMRDKVLALVGRIQELEAEVADRKHDGAQMLDLVKMKHEAEIESEARAVKAEAERDTLREALDAVFKVAVVANEGDPWYCENEGVDVSAAFSLARAALTRGAGDE